MHSIGNIRHLTKIVGAGVLASSIGIANAEININGFASVGGGWYNGDSTGASYAGFDQDFQADPVTKLGLQFSSQINEKVSGTGQLLAKGTNDYDIEAAWAYLTYAANDEWDVRLGRLRSPFFAYSDFLDVGYAYPWISPPNLVYRFVFDTVEGLDTLYRTSHGMWDATYQVYYGRLTDETRLQGEDVDIDLKNFFGLNASFTKDWLTLRASYNRAKFTIESPTELASLLAALRNTTAPPFGATFNQAADALEVENETGIFWGLGALIDYNDWLFNAEYTEINVGDQSAVSEDKGWYAMIGKRIDEFTVHLTYAAQESDPDLDAISEIPTANPAYALAQSALANSDQESIGVGVRYDFAPATSFKVEVTQVEDNIDNDDGTLVAFALDTVF